MTQVISRTIKESINHWWIFLLVGLILIVTGIWISLSPATAYVSLSFLFAINIFVTGIMEVIFSVMSRKSMEGWGWTLIGGLLDIVIGVYLLAYPLLTMSVLPFILGFWLLFKGFSAIGFAIDLKSYDESNWGVLLALGIIILLFAGMVLAVPAFGVLNIILWTSLSFIAAGVFRVVLAFRLKRLASYRE